MSEQIVSDPVVAELRTQITAVDRALLASVNERVRLVQQMFAHKQANDLPMIDAGREASMIGALEAENQGPLSADGVAELIRFVLDLCRREVNGE